MSGRHRQGAHFPPWLLFNSRSVKFPLYYLWGKWYYYHWLDIIITKSSSSCQGPCCYSGCRWSWAWPCRTWRAWGLRRGHRACSPSPGHRCLPQVTNSQSEASNQFTWSSSTNQRAGLSHKWAHKRPRGRQLSIVRLLPIIACFAWSLLLEITLTSKRHCVMLKVDQSEANPHFTNKIKSYFSLH